LLVFNFSKVVTSRGWNGEEERISATLSLVLTTRIELTGAITAIVVVVNMVQVQKRQQQQSIV
jgi:hypothetical protein